MTKKMWAIALFALTLIFFISCLLTEGFTRGVLSDQIYRPQNVFEEIWNLVASEENGRATVLTLGSEDGYVDYDLGVFDHIDIPECDIVLCRDSGDELRFQFRLDKGGYVIFIYDYKTKTLYGDNDKKYLAEHFLGSYFGWCRKDEFTSSYYEENFGRYSFKYANPIYDR